MPIAIYLAWSKIGTEVETQPKCFLAIFLILKERYKKTWEPKETPLIAHVHVGSFFPLKEMNICGFFNTLQYILMKWLSWTIQQSGIFIFDSIFSFSTIKNILKQIRFFPSRKGWIWELCWNCIFRATPKCNS